MNLYPNNFMNRFFSCWLLLLIGLNPSQLLALDLSAAGIKSSQQIDIPGYPNAFNPSLIAYENGYLLSFRVTEPLQVQSPLRSTTNYVGLVKLDEKFKPVKSSIQLLDIVAQQNQVSISAEDARLFSVNDRVYIIFNDLHLDRKTRGNAMYFGELIEWEGIFLFKGRPKPLNYARAAHIEKNWSPFVSDGRLYLIYADEPRTILELDLPSGRCFEVCQSKSELDWKWGEVRGGTPAVEIEEGMLTFFHSSILSTFALEGKWKTSAHYVMGAYLFDKDAPFSIRLISPSPIGDDSFTFGEKRRKAVFPGGLVVKGDLIHVAWGKSDREVFITTFNKGKLLDSMVAP